mgnify:FL=1
MRITNEQNDIAEVLFSQEMIKQRVDELAVELTTDYEQKDPLMVCVLKGASFFYADLCRSVKCRLFMDFIAVSSYGTSARSTGVVKIINDLDKNITDKHVIIVEDIIDSGLTLKYLTELFRARKPASIKTICLVDKINKHQCEIKPDYCGFTMGDHFVVGYGLDYSDYYRNLPYIGILKPETYE